MARPTCVKCGDTRFELDIVEPRNSYYKFNFVMCSGCGGVVGVLDYYNIGYLVRKLAEKLRVSLD